MTLTTKKVLPFAALFIYWLVLNYLVLHAPISFFEVPEVTPVTQASVVPNDAVSPQTLSSADWMPVSLPDDWHTTKRLENQHWYRSRVSLSPQNAEVWAVYLPSVTHNAAVYINGVWVGQGGRFEDPVARNHNRPLLFRFSSQLLHPGENTVLLKVRSSFHEQGLLDQFYIAPESQLYAAYLWKIFVRVELIQWFTLIMYVMAAILFAFWLARPQDKTYGLFALLLTIWGSHNLNLFVIEIPTSTHFWEAMTMSTLGWIVVVMIFFNHRYVGQKNSRVEQLVLLFAFMGMAIFVLPDVESILLIGYRVWDSFLIVFGSYAIFHLARVYWSTRDTDVYLMLLVGVPILVFGFHDILTVNNLRDRRDGLTIQYSIIPAALLFSFFLIRRFVQSINQAEEMAATMEARVQDREDELRSQYDKLHHLEQQRVLSEERERIMRDMHDGIGGQLVSVISLLQEQHGELFVRIQTRVRQSLMDLRSVIDSLDPVLSDLPTLLGMMRESLQEQLDAASINLTWAATDLPAMGALTPKMSLHIMRIVQEAVANTIKHSGATDLNVASYVEAGEEPCVVVALTDNGKGMGKRVVQQSGRGVSNMRYRAEQIGATLETEESCDGFCIRLILPLNIV